MKKCKTFLSVIIFCALCPVLCCSAAPSTSARGAILICAESGEVLFRQNADSRLPMASTTKIMTALLLAEHGEPNKTIIATKEMVTVEGSSMGLLAGDTVSYRDLLYGMLLASGNDAANTTAITLGSSVAGFAEMMNNKAAEIGLQDTNFVSPSGLDDENHYTTAADLAALAAYALKNESFAAACSAESARLYYGNPPYYRTLSNHNRLLSYYNGCIGVKTGFTKRSGRCLVSAARRNSTTLVAVTLNDGNDWSDHAALLDYGFSLMSEHELTSDIPDSLTVIGGNQCSVKLSEEPAALSMTENERSSVTSRIFLNEFLYAPLSAGEIVGRVDYYINGCRIASAAIKTDESVAAAEYEPQPKNIGYYIKQLLK